MICKWIRKQWRKKGYTIVDAQVRGINYRLHTHINTTDGKLLTSSKFYDHQEIKALSNSLRISPAGPGEESVFIDIGANTGYYSLTLAQRGFSRILAIEPNPTTLNLGIMSVLMILANQLQLYHCVSATVKKLLFTAQKRDSEMPVS
jgi:hypothetical protein